MAKAVPLMPDGMVVEWRSEMDRNVSTAWVDAIDAIDAMAIGQKAF